MREVEPALAQKAGWVEIPVDHDIVRGILHPSRGTHRVAILVGGAGGGVYGPAGVYEPLAERLQREGIAVLRLDYRCPNYLKECIDDVLAALELFEHQGIDRAVLVGWSFGGAVVISAGVASPIVAGVATVASQTYGADAVSHLSPKSLLLLHGTGDRTLPDRCSRQLYAAAGEPRELVLYEGDNHGIDRNADRMLDKLYTWSTELLRDA